MSSQGTTAARRRVASPTPGHCCANCNRQLHALLRRFANGLADALAAAEELDELPQWAGTRALEREALEEIRNGIWGVRILADLVEGSVMPCCFNDEAAGRRRTDRRRRGER